jgi:hypothetical protein
VRSTRAAARGAAMLMAAMLGCTGAEAATGTVKVRYAMTLAGLPIGTARLEAAIRDDDYKLTASAKVGGILSLVSDGKGAATSSGRIASDRPVAAGYALNTISEDKQQIVRMALSPSRITDVEVRPPVPPRADRVPVRDEDMQGVMDPLSALLMPVSGGPALLSAKACDRTLPVFDGAQRFDVTLSYSRMEKVRSEAGYSGPALVCAARYKPISGYRAKRDQTRFMAENKDLEVWLAPIEGTRVLAPWRIVVGTQIGRLVIEAERFLKNDERAPIKADTN